MSGLNHFTCGGPIGNFRYVRRARTGDRALEIGLVKGITSGWDGFATDGFVIKPAINVEELAETQQVSAGRTTNGCTIELTLLQDLVNGLRQPVYVLLSHGVGEDEPHPVTGVVTLYQQADHEA